MARSTMKPGQLRRLGAVFFLLVLLAALLAAGCRAVENETPTLLPPTDTPTPKPPTPTPIPAEELSVRIRFPDGSIVAAAAGSDFEILQIGGASGSGHVLKLLRGELMVISHLPPGVWFTVLSPEGYLARVSGSIMVVGYQDGVFQYTMDCVEGVCELGPKELELIRLAADQQGWLDANGEFQGPFAVDLEALRTAFGEELVAGGPTLTPTPTPDVNATATAVCADFQAQFPGTPCP